jgi:hypothetical protein
MEMSEGMESPAVQPELVLVEVVDGGQTVVIPQ